MTNLRDPAKPPLIGDVIPLAEMGEITAIRLRETIERMFYVETNLSPTYKQSVSATLAVLTGAILTLCNKDAAGEELRKSIAETIARGHVKVVN